MKLRDLKKGERGVILAADSAFAKAFAAKGFCVGEVVECRFRSPLGDPTAYLARGVTTAVRFDDAGHVLVRKL